MGQQTSAATAQTLADQVSSFVADLRARGINAVVRRGPQQRRPVQPLPAGFDVEAARAELAALEAAGPGVSEFDYRGESAQEIAEWREQLHRHQIAGLRAQIAQHEAKAIAEAA